MYARIDGRIKPHKKGETTKKFLPSATNARKIVAKENENNPTFILDVELEQSSAYFEGSEH